MAASDICREHVLEAISEFEELGRAKFLKKYDHTEARRFRVVYNGKFYDSKAIAGAAHGYATGVFLAKKDISGGYSPGAAATILSALDFYLDNGTLFAIEKVHADLSHGKRAPYQYIVLLWAFARARDGATRIVRFSDIRAELAQLLAPFAIGKTAPDPAMPWAALASFDNEWGSGFRVPMLWEVERHGLIQITDSDVKRLNIAAGLGRESYETAASTTGFMQAAAEVMARYIGSEPAFPQLLAELDIGGVSGGVSADVADAVSAADEIANPRRRFGRRLSAAENKAIEERAVWIVRNHYEVELGYATEDVGATESYDIHATKGDSVVKVEVKGTTSDGSEIVLTAKEVALHLAAYPNNALAVVRRIVLECSGEKPIGTGGELVLVPGWKLDESRLKAISYRYPTGL